ncbi:PIN domain-containing protein [Actomonas aquatica]|uniref:PIN domain-containing protein n=1 Tax=Actomonas aquatica TaxID=2866162 RepID=A0ABZ1C2B6_9BACT|nr:PIN domain-containing protein [Opitutus sp. WL0086]WRQ85842.1 PIN domain-containing protein [Opitutus sp. WL0086]
MSEALYIDTSCWLKLLFPEPESAAVAALMGAESLVVVSSLVRVEAEQQIASRRAGGLLTAAKHKKVQRAMNDLLGMEPFQARELGGVLWPLALEQIARAKEPCRTLDRLHLAAMAELGVTRILTHDRRQEAAAREMGYAVVVPRV